VVELDQAETRAMFKAIAHHEFESYYADHDVEELPGSRGVD
jgi:hypothetical protein